MFFLRKKCVFLKKNEKTVQRGMEMYRKLRYDEEFPEIGLERPRSCVHCERKFLSAIFSWIQEFSSESFVQHLFDNTFPQTVAKRVGESLQ